MHWAPEFMFGHLPAFDLGHWTSPCVILGTYTVSVTYKGWSASYFVVARRQTSEQLHTTIFFAPLIYSARLHQCQFNTSNLSPILFFPCDFYSLPHESFRLMQYRLHHKAWMWIMWSLLFNPDIPFLLLSSLFIPLQNMTSVLIPRWLYHLLAPKVLLEDR